MKKNINQELLSIYNDMRKLGIYEDSLNQIEEILRSYPESVKLFVDLFEENNDLNDKETLATIIIEHKAHKKAIDFLINKMGWKEEDFEGYSATENNIKM